MTFSPLICKYIWPNYHYQMTNTGCTAVNVLSPSPPAIIQQFQETETQLKQTVYEAPNNDNYNGALEAADPAGHPQSHCAESTSIQLFTILRKGRKRKKTALAIQRHPSGLDEIHNIHPTGLPSPDYIRSYVNDRLTGKITCMVCGEEGHYTCDCPMKDRENKVMCTRCNKVGHCYLWCCRQHVSENRACRRCGEKGHYTNKDLSHCVRCSSCDESHPLGRCPMGKVTCFLCEGKDHVPAHCRLSPTLTVTQYYRESFRAILKQALTETSRRAVTPAKLSCELVPHDDSHECQFKRNDKMVHTVSNFIRCEQGDCERKNAAIRLLDFGETNSAAWMEKGLTQGSSSACHEEGQYANKCPKKKLPGEQELPDVTCFNCHDKGHYSFSCPVNKPPGGLELHDVTCINFDANKCDLKKPPGGLLRDVTCFTCHDKGHYSNSCPKNKPPGHCHVEGHNTKRYPKKKRKKEQQK